MDDIDYRNWSDRDILIQTHTLVRRVENAVFGNGQPGLVAKVAALEERTSPTSKAAKVGAGSGVTALALALAALLRSLGVPFPGS